MADLIDLVNDRLYSERAQTSTSTSINLTIVYVDTAGKLQDTVEPDTRLLQGFSHVGELGVDEMHGSYAFGYKKPDGSIDMRYHGEPQARERLIELLNKPS